jgi:hypothetical protein
MIQNTKPIFPESDEAAEFRRIGTWVDRKGVFWGSDERMARWAGSTHRHCLTCAETVLRDSPCATCVRQQALDRYRNAQEIDWDHKTPLYSQAHDKYLFDKDCLFHFMCETEVTNPDELELFICEPVKLGEVPDDYWDDDLPGDSELPLEIKDALEVFNTAIRKSAPVNWSPGKLAININSLKLGI